MLFLIFNFAWYCIVEVLIQKVLLSITWEYFVKNIFTIFSAVKTLGFVDGDLLPSNSEAVLLKSQEKQSLGDLTDSSPLANE